MRLGGWGVGDGESEWVGGLEGGWVGGGKCGIIVPNTQTSISNAYKYFFWFFVLF